MACIVATAATCKALPLCNLEGVKLRHHCLLLVIISVLDIILLSLTAGRLGLAMHVGLSIANAFLAPMSLQKNGLISHTLLVLASLSARAH